MRSAAARPATARDRALLARPATAEEKVAERVAERLTGHRNVAVRCGSIGICDPHVLGVTPILNGRSFDYFLMRPAECTYLAWFHDSPSRWDPRTCAPADCSYTVDIAWALQTVAHESYHLLGYTNEAQVDCYGMQSIWFVAHAPRRVGRRGAGVREPLRDADLSAAADGDAGVLVGAVPRRRSLRPAPEVARLAQLETGSSYRHGSRTSL